MANSTRIMTMYDVPMWESISRREWSLQRCCDCAKVRYPPSPICPECRCMESDWVPLKGTGELLSWTVFHRQYFDDHPPPYNVVTVRLDEGPIIVTNLSGAEPDRSSIGRRVEIVYEPHLDYLLPRVTFAPATACTA